PEEKGGGWVSIIVAVADDLIGEIEFLAIEPPIVLDMLLVVIGGDGDMLERGRHLRRRDIAQFEKARQEFAVAGGKADAQSGKTRSLRQRMKDDDVLEVGAGGLEHTGRRALAIDLAITFVGQNKKAVTACQRRKLIEIGAVGDGALRVGRRSEIERDGARQ